MSGASERFVDGRLEPEKVAYWYFRLNGFFQIENIVAHPARQGSQRTDADLLAVRFPFRVEGCSTIPMTSWPTTRKGSRSHVT
jgi:hypothetical protein